MSSVPAVLQTAVSQPEQVDCSAQLEHELSLVVSARNFPADSRGNIAVFFSVLAEEKQMVKAPIVESVLKNVLNSIEGAGQGNTEIPVWEEVITGAGIGNFPGLLCLKIEKEEVCLFMITILNLQGETVIRTEAARLESPRLTEEERSDFDSYSHNPATDSIFVVSAMGVIENKIPNYATATNKPSLLSCICLKYTGPKSFNPLRQAITRRLFGQNPTIGSIQPDGSYTFFFELKENVAMPQDKQQAEDTLKAWLNAHGLTAIAGAQLDKEHFFAQLENPTFVGEILYKKDSLMALRQDKLFIQRLARELSEGVILFEPKDLLKHMNSQSWNWKSDEPFAPGCIGVLEAGDELRFPAIVTAKGFRSLGNALAFYGYSDIIGADEWEALNATKDSAEAIHDSFFYQKMGKECYVLVSDGKSRKCTYVEYTACLRSNYALGNESPSTVVTQVLVNKRVDGTCCCMYKPNRLVYSEGRCYINTSDVRVLPPKEDAPSDRFKASCPAIAKLLHSLFGAKSEELEVFLAWLAIAYQGAYYGRPQRGHAMYVVGAPGTGKTLLRELIGELFGRSRSGHEFFCENSPFNACALEDNPLVYLDDATIDWRRCNQMHNRIKELVATGSVVINGKYEAQRQAEWNGRVLVVCNPTGEGRKLIPEVNDDNRDKLIILQTKDTIIRDQHLGEKARRELPSFAHFLKHHRSSLMKAGVRFGMEAYVSPAIREATLFRDGEGLLMECLERLLKAENRPGEEMDYTVSELYDKLSEQTRFSGQAGVLCTAKNLGVKLAKIREAVTSNVVGFPYAITNRRTSARRSWVFTPHEQEAANN